MSGVLYPRARNSFFMFSKFCASFKLGAVMRTYSQPASIMRMDCSTVAIVSNVFVVVMDCKRIGFSPPIGTSPIVTTRVFQREYFVSELQYGRKEFIAAKIRWERITKSANVRISYANFLFDIGIKYLAFSIW